MAVSQGRSELAQGLIGRAGDELSGGFDWEGLPTPAGAPEVPDFYGQGLGQMGSAPNARSNTPFPTAPGGGGLQDRISMLNKGAPGGPGQGGLAGWGQTPGAPDQGNLPGRGPAADPTMQGLGATGQGPTQGQYNPEDIQRGLDFSGEQSLNAGGGYNPDFAQTQFDRQMSLQQPLMERATTQMDTKLRNQGLSPGTPAYDNAMNDLRNNQGEQTSRMQQDSMRLGAQEQQSQFARELQARQQGVGEVAQQGGFANDASQQALQQQLGIGGAQFGESLGAGQFAESQRGQRAAETGQQYGQNLQASQQLDSQRGQGLQEQNQQFQQGLAGSQQQNALRAQQFSEQQAREQAQGGAAQAQFQRELDASKYQDQQRAQQVNEQLAFGGQGFQQQMQQAQYQQGLRQQAIAEEAQRRGMSINEMNALISGQQIGTPQMPNFQGAGRADATNYLGAAQAQGNFDQQTYSTALGPLNAAIDASSAWKP